MKGREGESKFKMFSAQKIVSCSLLFRIHSRDKFCQSSSFTEKSQQ